ncbi:hypothetical protein BDZ97DRAFT_2063373 [Flammula alnicola]|nr:hypothetical protein BDZ97DRAFT_2063373 [Flammula alnicola]
MQILPLSPEICRKIASFLAGPERRDLLALCLTCKAFQREAEPRIYTQLVFGDPQRTLGACNTIINNERLALLVRTFWFNLEPRCSRVNLGRDFWLVVQKALIATANLEVLLICDNTFSNSWIFDAPEISFRLREARLKFAWDASIVRFLETQQSLRMLHFYDAVDDVPHHMQPYALPDLKMFDGTLMIGTQFLSSNISHLQLVVDSEPGPALTFLSLFGSLRKTLRAFSLLDVPEELTIRVLSILSQTLPDLRHIGLFPYPMTANTQRHEFHKDLMTMHYLYSIELDLARWNPLPNSPSSQRSLAAELRTFCPSITVVIFWMGTTRIRWAYSNQQWQSRVETQQFPQLSETWRLV